MSRRILGPFNRIEGDLEVKIDSEQGQVKQAFVNSTLFRGFEQILQGKDPRDALVYTPRICGICSVSQSVAAATALMNAMDIAPAPNGQLATNLMLACENAADHLTHFYLFFMPDFARAPYADKPWFEEIAQRFTAQKGQSAVAMLKARADWLHLTGVLAGKWPHSLAIQPGGSSRAITAQERIQMLGTIGAFRQFLQQQLFGDELESVISLNSEDALDTWREKHVNSDFDRFLNVAEAINLDALGQIDVPLMSYGAYALYEPLTPRYAFSQGVLTLQQGLATLDASKIAEDVSHSRESASPDPLHPYDGRTQPIGEFNEETQYSWCKAPRLDTQVVEVGALARQAVNAHPLIMDLLKRQGSNVRLRVIARLLELAQLVPLMEQWVKQLAVGDVFCHHGSVPDYAQGAGMVEAARGSLGHWLSIEKGRIANYQIIAPTTWNFS
ncbi:MAG: nickel-dependent hydrogenase large subunit, partial [Pseudomonadota bacterium]|nr:nickel-dependent hydrogenase large subunit [Pseudomonadota bacterium]